MGGAVTYTNESKTKVLGVPAELIAEHGAVSPEVAEAMADGALEEYDADIGVGITGIAGPDGRHRGKAGRLRLRVRQELRRIDDRPRPRHARERAPTCASARRSSPCTSPAGSSWARTSRSRALAKPLAYEISVDEAVLDDLRERLSGTRWPEAADVGWEYGMDQGFLRRLCEHWASDYDWRATESRLNEFEHATWEGIHFIRAGEGAGPIVLVHGWPGAVLEFERADPAPRRGGPRGDRTVPCRDTGSPRRPRSPQRRAESRRGFALWSRTGSASSATPSRAETGER